MADRYEQLFSATIEDSDVSRINQANGSFVAVDDETVDLLEAGLEYCRMTDGVFDITVGLSPISGISATIRGLSRQKPIFRLP